jgi:transcriptional regulator with XRE-family HTH domain
MTLGQMVRDGRKAMGYTQRELAERVEVNFTYVSKIENGRMDFPPSDALIANLAWVLRLDRDSLFVAAGKCPPDLLERLKTDLAFVRAVRALGDL